MRWLFPDRLRDKVSKKINDEFLRMAKIIEDRSDPLRKMEVIVNNPKANKFFVDLLKTHRLNGRVINR